MRSDWEEVREVNPPVFEGRAESICGGVECGMSEMRGSHFQVVHRTAASGDNVYLFMFVALI